MELDKKVNQNVITLQFADDIAVGVKKDSPYDLIKKTRLAINIIDSNLENSAFSYGSSSLKIPLNLLVDGKQSFINFIAQA